MSDDNFLADLRRGERLRLGATRLKNTLPPLLSSSREGDSSGSSSSNSDEDKKKSPFIMRRRGLKKRFGGRSLASRIIRGEEIGTSDEEEVECG